ncbi:MAG: extracellular solute-binding protein [Eubacterium sp.]|nr:extracellular solute-binding protein [Eubacterium sp.]
MSKLMKKKGLRNFLIFVLLVVALVVFFQIKGNSKSDNSAKYKGVDFENTSTDYGRSDTYAQYVKAHGENEPAGDGNAYDVDLFKAKTSNGTEKRPGVGPNDDKSDALQIPEEGFAEFTIDVKEEGYYNIYTEYFPTTDEDDRGINIEAKVEINGQVPFNGADSISFQRVYVDKGEPTKDNQGNEVRPTQVQDPNQRWMPAYFEDGTGYEVDPYKFFFKKGKNVLRITGVNEKFVIRKLKVANMAKTPTYEEYAKGISEENTAQQGCKKIQGEDAVRRSAPSLYATYDRTSSDTEYVDNNGKVSVGNTSKQVLDMTGGTQWKVPNDWIEWEFEVEEEGNYVIGIKGRQGYNRGYIANRSLYIDGVIPFEEVSQIRFSYSNYWDMTCLQDAKGNPYKFHLTKGKHVIRLKNTLGDLGKYLSELSDSVFNMNKMYRTILVLTGTEPDEYRDYQIEKVYPEVIEAMDLESKRLYKLVDEVTEYAGEKSGEISVAQTLAAQMELFVERPDKIPGTLANFKENISSLGTSINNLSAAAMDIDYIAIADDKKNLPSVSEGGFDKMVHESILFFNSFRSDSSALGNVYDSKDKDVIDVWITAGRDQSTILKNMVDQVFTPESNIKVNVKLIDAANTVSSAGVNAMLPAVISGFGPDVALSIAQTEPVNYALRNAVVDLTQFPDLNDVLSEYYESSYVSYEFNNGIYALPETQNYNVMFYRTDIMGDLGVDVEKDVNTWDDVLSILPILQKNSMTFAVPSVERKIGNTTNPDLANYYAQLYQRGGTLYDDQAMETTIGTAEGIDAFEFYTKLFTNYKLAKQYDFVNRFRSGEMPIGVADYNNFNTLAVFAPEIKGLWNFAKIPGVKDKNGRINRATQSWGTCSMMLRGAEERNKKENSWKFLKWWASAETQATFASELEAVMGASARYATANKKTFDTLSWSSKESAALKEQWKSAFGLPEVAGGYYTSRHITNAIRRVMNQNEDPRETILDYVRTINEEITNKRQEFGLPVKKE